jgi:hypothetical protein
MEGKGGMKRRGEGEMILAEMRKEEDSDKEVLTAMLLYMMHE